MIIQPNTTINIRSEEERAAFIDVGEKEGIRWAYSSATLRNRQVCRYPAIYIDYKRRALTAGHDYTEDPATTIVEASELFHNYLISKSIKEAREVRA